MQIRVASKTNKHRDGAYLQGWCILAVHISNDKYVLNTNQKVG
jgi:hypothetical protein